MLRLLDLGFLSGMGVGRASRLIVSEMARFRFDELGLEEELVLGDLVADCDKGHCGSKVSFHTGTSLFLRTNVK